MQLRRFGGEIGCGDVILNCKRRCAAYRHSLQGFDAKYEDFSIVNAMLPTRYLPSFAGNTYEKRAQAFVAHLFPGTPMAKDYDQLLDKRPGKLDAVFAWHQDMAYWPTPDITPDTRTATFSLAIDATRRANGCLKFISGSQSAKALRPHVPIGTTREEAHAIAIKVDEAREVISFAEIARGDVTIHDEYVVHGSGGNETKGHRRTCVLPRGARNGGMYCREIAPRPRVNAVTSPPGPPAQLRPSVSHRRYGGARAEDRV